jgi:hypothetical protein
VSEVANNRVVGVIVADLERTAIGTRSRASDVFAGRAVLGHVVGRLLAVSGVGEVIVVAPAEQADRVWELIGPEDRVRVLPLERRPAGIDTRVRRGRAWNLHAWRGGAGQWTVFDEEYHPAALARACREAFGGEGAGHVLAVHSHGVFLDVGLTGALVHHHLHKNHEMRVTYTPAAPGLGGMVLRADIVKEMGEKAAMPWQLLGYDPKAPSFDTLIREACMQVDPALSKIPNRFCVDTQRGWDVCAGLAGRTFESAAELCLAAAQAVAPGVKEPSAGAWPREVQMEWTARRVTRPPGAVPGADGAGELDAARWRQWLAGQHLVDDLLVTVGGDGDPLLSSGLLEVLRAVRGVGALGICVQTDLAEGDVDGLLAAVREGVVDVVSVPFYGHTRETYARVAGVTSETFDAVMRNMGRLAEVVAATAGGVLVVPRLLKVRETIPELEAFFDFWIERCGWAVIDGPTDRAGAVPFAGVVDMAPPRRKACRRIWDRLVVRADGTGVACDQDVCGRLRVGHIESNSLQEMWAALGALRGMHADGRWGAVTPCATCREWHRA